MPTQVSRDHDLAEAAILSVLAAIGVGGPDKVLADAARVAGVTRDVVSVAMQVLVGQNRIRFNDDLKLELGSPLTNLQHPQ